MRVVGILLDNCLGALLFSQYINHIRSYEVERFMSSLAHEYYTPEEYLALEREAEYKSEYINGQIFAMSGTSRAHSLIATNLIIELGTQLRGKPCDVHGGDMRVKVSPIGMYTYPDVSVACGEPHFEDREVDSLTNPSMIFEILSLFTEKYDRGQKFAHYRRLGSLTDYVLVSQDKAQVEHFVRQGNTGEVGESDRWVFTELSDPASNLRLLSIGCSVALRSIYDRIELTEEDAATSSDGEAQLYE